MIFRKNIEEIILDACHNGQWVWNAKDWKHIKQLEWKVCYIVVGEIQYKYKYVYVVWNIKLISFYVYFTDNATNTNIEK